MQGLRTCFRGEGEQLPGPGEEAMDVVEGQHGREAPDWCLGVPLAKTGIAALVSLVYVYTRGAFPSALNEEEMS